MITTLINLNEKLIVKKPPNLSRSVIKTATQNQIIVYAFVSSNLFTQLNTLTELTNNFASVSFIILQCRNENILMSSKLHTFSIEVFFFYFLIFQHDHLS